MRAAKNHRAVQVLRGSSATRLWIAQSYSNKSLASRYCERATAIFFVANTDIGNILRIRSATML